MGRQIRFIHSERDLIPFLSNVVQLGGEFWIGGKVYQSEDAVQCLLDKMNTDSCFAYILHLSQNDCEWNTPNPASVYGIEFSNCYKGNALSRTYYVGRLYIQPDSQGNYIPEVEELYAAIAKYIKKNYDYIKKYRLYVGSDFHTQYKRRYYFAIDTITPLVW